MKLSDLMIDDIVLSPDDSSWNGYRIARVTSLNSSTDFVELMSDGVSEERPQGVVYYSDDVSNLQGIEITPEILEENQLKIQYNTIYRLHIKKDKVEKCEYLCKIPSYVVKYVHQLQNFLRVNGYVSIANKITI